MEMEKMQVEWLAINKVKPYGKNPRKNDNAVDAVAKSIQEFGWKQPLVIDPDTMEIIVGHTRYKASKKLGLKTVPCVLAHDLTEEQKKAYRLADNKTNELAEWDDDLLKIELDEIVDIDMGDFGFVGDDFRLEPQEIVEDEVPEVDEESEPVAKLGDIWQLGEHRLMCGDSTDKATVEKLMNGAKADLFLTDPPYNVAYEGKTADALTIQNDEMESEEFKQFLTKAFGCANDNLREGGGVLHLVCFKRAYQL